MKRLLLTSFFSLGVLAGFTQKQTYTFSKCTETLMYKDQYGNDKHQEVGTTRGRFDFEFEKSPNDNRPLFTLYIDFKEDQWYSQMKSLGNQEKNGEVYQTYLYLATTTREQVVVVHPYNRSKIVMLYSDRFLTYHN